MTITIDGLEVLISLKIRDRDIVDFLSKYLDTQQSDQVAIDALKIGVYALSHVSISSDVDYVKHTMEVTVLEIKNSLSGLPELVKQGKVFSKFYDEYYELIENCEE